MTVQSFEKILTANDTGETGGHQAGIHIPKSQRDLIRLLPVLNAAVKNPYAWLQISDDHGVSWRFRYIYYNNSLHEPEGTRDEYRITHMTGFFRALGAVSGDILTLSGEPDSRHYTISIRKARKALAALPDDPVRVRLRGWRRIY